MSTERHGSEEQNARAESESGLYRVSPQLEEQLIGWRRHLHRHPELSFQETQTSAFVAEQLSSMPGLLLSRPTPTSVLAVLRTGRPGPTALLRADMDALPIQEESGAPYASAVPGVMHACGHDGHTAMLLAAARALSERREQLVGEVRLIFQHAEETPPGGAVELVAAGVTRGVTYALGAHLWAAGPSGAIGIGDGAQTAAPDRFDVTVRGRGGHGAMPHQTVDPVVVAAQVILAAQTVVSRSLDPLERAVLSVTQLDAGSAYNVIPDTVRLQGTARTFTPEARVLVQERLRALLTGITAAYGATFELEYICGYPSVVNDPALTARVRAVARAVVGEAGLRDLPPSMAGEDFAYFSEQVPSCFFSVGSGNEALGITAPHHHPRFDIDEPALKRGTELFVNTVLTLNRRSGPPSTTHPAPDQTEEVSR